MVKYAANAALATKISFADEIAGLCELTGADARSVLPAVGADPRIGEQNLSRGWAGAAPVSPRTPRSPRWLPNTASLRICWKPRVP